MLWTDVGRCWAIICDASPALSRYWVYSLWCVDLRAGPAMKRHRVSKVLTLKIIPPNCRVEKGQFNTGPLFTSLPQHSGEGSDQHYTQWANIKPALVQCLCSGHAVCSITWMTMHWIFVQPSSAMLAQHWASIGWIYCMYALRHVAPWQPALHIVH